MTEDRTSTTAEAERGRRELARAVRRLERVLAKNAAAGCSLCVAIGDRTLTIDTELAALARGAATDDPALSGLALRVQGWQVKTLGDLDRLSAVRGSGPGGGELPTPALVFDLAAGKLLGEELSSAAERHGHDRVPRWLNQLKSLRHRLGQRLLEIEEILQGPCEGDVDEAVAILRNLGEGLDPGEAAALSEARGSARGGIRESRPSRVVLALSIVLVLALAGHVAANGSRWFEHETQGVLSLRDFQDLPGVYEIEDCPPSVFLTVRNETWAALDESGRLAMLDEARAVIGRHGYEGALVSTEDGAVVAQWATHSGNVLFDSE